MAKSIKIGKWFIECGEFTDRGITFSVDNGIEKFDISTDYSFITFPLNQENAFVLRDKSGFYWILHLDGSKSISYFSLDLVDAESTITYNATYRAVQVCNNETITIYGDSSAIIDSWYLAGI